MTTRKDFLLALVAFYRWFCACGVTVGANLLLNFLVFDRLRTPATVKADILSSLIVFYTWFCKRATAEADFLGSCRKHHWLNNFVRKLLEKHWDFSIFFVSAYKFAYLMNKNTSTLYSCIKDCKCATHSTCIKDYTCGTKCRVVSLLFPRARRRNNERNTNFLYSKTCKSKSKHSNPKKAWNKPIKRTNTKQEQHWTNSSLFISHKGPKMFIWSVAYLQYGGPQGTCCKLKSCCK